MKKIVLISLIIAMSGSMTQITRAENNVPLPNTQKSISNTATQVQSWLGVWIENIPVSLGNHLLSVLKKDQGIMIKKISPDSPAATARLKVHDIIAKFNDQDISSQQQFVQLIQSAPPETKVTLSLVRQGKLMTQDVTLKALPGRDSLPAANSNRHHPHFLPRDKAWGQFPHPMMNQPFFDSGFNQHFENEMNQLRKKMNQLQWQMNQQGQQNSWSEFQSIQIESTGNNTHRAKVIYEDSESNKKEFIFEGNPYEIQQQIMSQDNMDEDKKQSLLQALDMNNRYSQPFRQNNFMNPGGFNRPSPRQNWFQYNQ
ncbi:MAG: PDZ domain-containing protein [gamma proteobacterium symbiont of Bathyaustriella thionipta]|nr:PDZ domain-containing protein [gamma proteobacterium symbiont of Bathyaustriella thionipta]MCU7951408.1 PDZ domain-containing protein [gamma proteobacterium symbiont of Bathyaustriella thionipta]MCU7952506.1 PDZ domain-containing protein [gamma proteobacterium symbiont of Bathyaustriella thionipta]MCU7957960.1 PDZ domain-containing protein [gamma proteobacterium symbiont of Bathyaustriella thionipta]MCU7968686.1 PDZ domain-containing protein [gamma proteobacterium symbiont of Bathyaustriella